MAYGGTRDWGLWVDTGSGMASRLYGPGYLYKTEAGAERGLQRLVDKGEVLKIEDSGSSMGWIEYRTVGLFNKVTIRRVRGT